MSMSKHRISLYDAQLKALPIVEELRPFCQRIEMAGSIRRKCEFVNDIEIVAIPRLEVLQGDLFGDSEPPMMWPGRRVLDDIEDLEIQKDGTKYIQFMASIPLRKVSGGIL